jgi:DNA polymerase-3 subunit chi
MTRIDFYVLPENASADATMTACKLCDKAVSAGQRVFVFAAAPGAAALDELLWTFRQGRFISHERASPALEPPLPEVLIGAAEPPDDYHEVLINLGHEVPPFFSRFERVLEIVAGDADSRAASRSRYKFYRDRGYQLASHKL